MPVASIFSCVPLHFSFVERGIFVFSHPSNLFPHLEEDYGKCQHPYPCREYVVVHDAEATELSYGKMREDRGEGYGSALKERWWFVFLFRRM